MARGKIPLARGIHSCSIYLLLLPDWRLHIVKNTRVYIQISDCSEMHINYRFYQIIVQGKHFYTQLCEVVTGNLLMRRRPNGHWANT